PSGVENLDVAVSLPPENIDPASILGSKIVEEFFAWAREHYDRVVVDSPPYGLVGDVVMLSVLVDAVMIMCCPDRTHFTPVQHAVRNLAEAGASVIGVVVNDVEMGGFGPGYCSSKEYGYYTYGYGYGAYAPTRGRAGDAAKSGETDARESDDELDAPRTRAGVTPGVDPSVVDDE
ncbi:MAG: hypothetical protein MJ138_04755, partial [Kiritimatiellae bacterium]|nr:hypothetical protein [Kiritimatiellia bacterium]